MRLPPPLRIRLVLCSRSTNRTASSEVQVGSPGESVAYRSFALSSLGSGIWAALYSELAPLTGRPGFCTCGEFYREMARWR